MDNPPLINIIGIFLVPIHDGELRDQLRSNYFFGNAVRDMSGAIYAFVES